MKKPTEKQEGAVDAPKERQGQAPGAQTGAGTPKRLKLIACEIFYRELCRLVAEAPHCVDCEFLPKGLHDIGAPAMRTRLQERIDAVDPARYEAIALAYGLCNHGAAGLRAPSIPLLIPRAHDCMTLFMGSRQRYQTYFEEHPGVYFHTSGWLERGEDAGELRQASIMHRLGLDRSYEELVEEYGEDNAQYILEQIGPPAAHYGQYTYIDMGLDPAGRFEAISRARAAERGWAFDLLRGDDRLLRALVCGPRREEDILFVPPGRKIRFDSGEGVLAVE